MKNMQNKRFSAATVKSKDGTKSFLPQKDTTVWQLEAAHSQTYYFISAPQGESTRSIGPFPQVSSNLRKTDKIRSDFHSRGRCDAFVQSRQEIVRCLFCRRKAIPRWRRPKVDSRRRSPKARPCKRRQPKQRNSSGPTTSASPRNPRVPAIRGSAVVKYAYPMTSAS